MTTTADRPTATGGIAAMMADPDWQPTRDQVADLISLMLENDDTDLAWRAGYEAGYQARVNEENAAYPPTPYRLTTSAGEDARRVHRSRCGVDRVEPRPGDFPGYGPEYVQRLREE